MDPPPPFRLPILRSHLSRSSIAVLCALVRRGIFISQRFQALSWKQNGIPQCDTRESAAVLTNGGVGSRL